MSGLLDFIYDSEIFIDLYEILEVDMDVKADEIKMAYIKLAKKNHPDQGGSSEKFQEITRAYEILFNKETRKEYDLYYLKKNMNEFKGDDMLRLRDDFKNFMSSNSKPISKEELDKLYAETFVEYREKYKESSVNEEELMEKMKDIEIERKNNQIEDLDDTLANFISQHKEQVNINDVFEYLKYKNSSSFSNSIVVKEWGTIDTMPGYSNGYSSFIDENEYFDSNLYSNISDMNASQSVESNNNLNIDEFVQWKSSKRADTKLSDMDINEYLKKRDVENKNISDIIAQNLRDFNNSNKTDKLTEDNANAGENLNYVKPEIKKSLVPEIIELDHDETNSNTNTSNIKSTDMDGMLKFMDEINSTNKQDFGELEKEIGMDKIIGKSNEYAELKTNANLPKVSNVRKREFK